VQTVEAEISSLGLHIGQSDSFWVLVKGVKINGGCLIRGLLILHGRVANHLQ
jgi:hypothetical protein